MKIELLDDKCLPAYSQDGDIGMDVRTRVDADWIWENGIQVCYLPLGFKINIPLGYGLFLYSRSGHGFKENIQLANSTGLIDQGFDHEVVVKLIKIGTSMIAPMQINKYDRVAQMVLKEIDRIYLKVVDKIDSSNRSEGFGSSGSR